MRCQSGEARGSQKKEITMKSSLFVILFSIFLYLSFISILKAQEIKKISGIKSVMLVVYENLGIISGYLIFRDDHNKVCGLDYYEEAELKCEAFTTNFKINPRDFRYLKLRSGDETFGYPIGYFIVEDLHKKYGGRTLKVEFKLGTSWLKTSCIFYVPDE